jgi:hypothetical protein
VLAARGAKRVEPGPWSGFGNVNAFPDRLEEWLRRFHGLATKNLPNDLGWRRSLEALGQQAIPDDLILGEIGLGPYQQLKL